MKRYMYNKTHLIVIIFLFIGFSFFFLSPLTLPLRETFVYQLAFRGVIALFLVYFMVKKPSKGNKWLENAIFIGIHSLLWGSLLPIDTRRLLLIFMSFSLISLLLLVYTYFKTKTLNNSLFVSVIFVYIIAVYPVLRITALDGKTSHFWQHALSFGVFMAGFCVILIRKYPHLINEKQDKYFAPILVMMVGFITMFLSLNSLNYTLDQSEANFVNGVVIDKDVDSGYRSITSYEVTLLLDNNQEIRLNVSQDVYEDSSLGESITINTYQGFFSIPYYIYEAPGR